MPDTAYISKITHGSTEDGRGIRTVVFFGGCSLGCKWCHNPECIPRGPILMHFENKCISCGQCVKICREVFSSTSEGIVIDRTKCDGCGKCISNCFGDALALSQCKMTARKIFEEIERDISYYKYSDGGVTFSGGECLRQPKELKSLLDMCVSAGINTCIESCFDVPYEVIDGIYQYVDSFFIDIKHMDPDIHRYYTGRDNVRILSNIKKLFRKHGDIIFRIPLIPGVNDSMENLEKTVDFVSGLEGICEKRIEILKYNDLAEPKYRSIGHDFTHFGAPQSDAVMEELRVYLNSLCDNVKVF